MAQLDDRETEALEAYRRYVAQRDRCVAGEAPWSTIGQWFTEDAVFIDPAWGRVVGRDASLGSWTTRWPARGVELPRGVDDGRRRPGRHLLVEPAARDRTGRVAVPGPGVLGHALRRRGLFDYELDLVNMAEVGELFGASSGWLPGRRRWPSRARTRTGTSPARRLGYPYPHACL